MKIVIGVWTIGRCFQIGEDGWPCAINLRVEVFGVRTLVRVLRRSDFGRMSPAERGLIVFGD